MNAPPPGQPRLVIVGATGMVGGYALCYALQGGRSPGTSSGTALTAMANVSAKTLPSGYGYEWTGTAYQEVAASGQTGALLVLAVLFAFYFSSVSTRAGSFRFRCCSRFRLECWAHFSAFCYLVFRSTSMPRSGSWC